MIDNIIRVEGLTKSFTIYHEKRDTLRENIFKIFSRMDSEELYALRDVSFEIRRGEFFGIIGKNGSGKSTLLKILSSVYLPDKGTVSVDGRISPFLELGVGFNPELTARENIFLSGMILGLSKAQIEKKFDEIIEFSELEQFVDTQLKHYSSGMYARLAFAVTIQVDADVFILDEVLAVGDASFNEKCFDVFRKLKEKGKTLVLVTHSMDNVKEFCDRAMLLDQGKLIFLGSPDDTIMHYEAVR